MNLIRTQLKTFLLSVTLALPTLASAGSLEASIRGADGGPLGDAVVYAQRLDESGAPIPAPERSVIDQVDKAYVPAVTAVMVGTEVSFPNRDPVRHHVYSFSDAKTFEIPLYKGTPREPILFDKPGVVTLGCNIHDWMMAHVFVSETPHFGVAGEDGQVTLDGLPAGDYAVYVWHPQMKGESEATRQNVSVPGASVSFSIAQKRVWRPRRAPSRGDAGY